MGGPWVLWACHRGVMDAMGAPGCCGWAMLGSHHDNPRPPLQVPAMLAARDEHPWVLLGLQSVGLLGGWGLLLGVALAEETLPH